MNYEQRLKTFKKAGKTAKLNMMKIDNFIGDLTAYEDYLKGKIHESIPEIEKTISKKKKEKAEVKSETLSNEQFTDIVIAFDTTGSMREYINDVKKHVMNLIPQLFKETKNLRIGIVAFGDYCDMPKIKQNENLSDISKCIFGKAYQVMDLTNDESKLIKFVQKAENTSGGDTPEFYDLVLNKIRLEMNWLNNSNKSILLIGDAPVHDSGFTTNDGYYNQFNWKTECNELLKSTIKLDTLEIKNEQWYKEASKITGGINLKFQNSSNTTSLLEGYIYKRSGSDRSFAKSYEKVMESKDDELIGVYKQLGEL